MQDSGSICKVKMIRLCSYKCLLCGTLFTYVPTPFQGQEVVKSKSCAGPGVNAVRLIIVFVSSNNFSITYIYLFVCTTSLRTPQRLESAYRCRFISIPLSIVSNSTNPCMCISAPNHNNPIEHSEPLKVIPWRTY